MSRVVRASGGTRHVDAPLFTIVTASYNQGAFLEETIRSILDQGRDDVEHIVMDGGSTDGSVGILERYDASLSHWVSEADGGQPAALNAGFRRARGQIVAFLNSDDLYRPGGLDAIAELAAREPEAEWLVGGTEYFGPSARALSYPGVRQSSAADVLYFGCYAPQPGHFFRRSAVERVGPFDESLQFSFDLDFFVRCALANVISAATETRVAAFRWHAASKSVAQEAKHRLETERVERRYEHEVIFREGWHARRRRDDYKGHLTLEAARDARSAGHRKDAWRLLGRAARRHPLVIPTRAFAGTVQRLLGLRAD